ncbi:hypothetical protein CAUPRSCDRAFT_11418 [Caulochytrium protostelioides]|uniref:Uncharacterized protein n=1 Tax=Caulochytrium protostelioides TaxID=1555241 RepID=A0A4P9WZT2_9FUNG|nr:hypothetical protein CAUPRSCDRAFT_11418 [Caulochytrium protostelioides]
MADIPTIVRELYFQGHDRTLGFLYQQALSDFDFDKNPLSKVYATAFEAATAEAYLASMIGLHEYDDWWKVLEVFEGTHSSLHENISPEQSHFLRIIPPATLAMLFSMSAEALPIVESEQPSPDKLAEFWIAGLSDSTSASVYRYAFGKYLQEAVNDAQKFHPPNDLRRLNPAEVQSASVGAAMMETLRRPMKVTDSLTMAFRQLHRNNRRIPSQSEIKSGYDDSVVMTLMLDTFKPTNSPEVRRQVIDRVKAIGFFVERPQDK